MTPEFHMFRLSPFILAVPFFLAASGSTQAGLPEYEMLVPLLEADFDDKELGLPITTGGATLGEPVSMSNGIETLIVEAGDGRALELTSTNLSSAPNTAFRRISTWVRAPSTLP